MAIQSNPLNGSLDKGSIKLLVQYLVLYRERLKGMHILLSGTQAGPGRTGKQEQ